MRATVTQTCEVECIQHYDEEQDRIVESDIERFNEGDDLDFDMLDEDGPHYFVQFPNGDVAFIPKEWINIYDRSE